MKAQADFDLSGRWTGIFNYPALMPPTGFEAILSDAGGAIGGTIWEQDDDAHGMGGSLDSIVEGHRQGQAVTFTKMYDDLDRMPDAVFYSGTIEPDGNEISGRWEIPGAWAGTFLMIRDSGAGETAEEEASEEVPVSEEARPL